MYTKKSIYIIIAKYNLSEDECDHKAKHKIAEIKL